jgi:hypothetical protein
MQLLDHVKKAAVMSFMFKLGCIVSENFRNKTRWQHYTLRDLSMDRKAMSSTKMLEVYTDTA